ncbi:hypothetical protein FH972_005707 [Carpinus fangiana]|uniref:Uncharacterized protein n=1 Tax=Carpinus fangiana TaxID=176857 RepID=A0A5N6QTC2_9ROSI|nr:hypothetical protein FH972_005707 [Carpinus fangiana]
MSPRHLNRLKRLLSVANGASTTAAKTGKGFWTHSTRISDERCLGMASLSKQPTIPSSPILPYHKGQNSTTQLLAPPTIFSTKAFIVSILKHQGDRREAMLPADREGVYTVAQNTE